MCMHALEETRESRCTQIYCLFGRYFSERSCSWPTQQSEDSCEHFRLRENGGAGLGPASRRSMSLKRAQDFSYDLPPADERKGETGDESDRHLGNSKVTHRSMLIRYPAGTMAPPRQKNVVGLNSWRWTGWTAPAGFLGISQYLATAASAGYSASVACTDADLLREPAGAGKGDALPQGVRVNLGSSYGNQRVSGILLVPSRGWSTAARGHFKRTAVFLECPD
jgi:hypothetical protein